MTGWTCASCHRSFETNEEWTDDQALAEAVERFPPEDRPTKEDHAEICDDCYAEFLVWYEHQRQARRKFN